VRAAHSLLLIFIAPGFAGAGGFAHAMTSGKGLDTERRWWRWPVDPLPVPAGIGLGLLGGAAAALAAWDLGPVAVGVLVVAFGLWTWVVGRHLRLVASGYPAEVEVEPPAPGPRLGVDQPDTHIPMVELPGGHFWMGSDPSLDPQARDDELPRRRVRLTPFAMAGTPVTRGLWRRVMAEAPDPWARPVPQQWPGGGDDLPATHVSWFDCLAFCNALSLLSDRSPCYRAEGEEWICHWPADGYRLPTEAEWEYACRGGSETPWFWGRWGRWGGGAADYAWYYRANSASRLHPVGRKRSNDFGLYDMAGNCWEWCWDWYAAYDGRQVDDPVGPHRGRLRVLRGGSFAGEPGVLRSAYRLRLVPGSRHVFIGFRCARSGARGSKP
jgi:sulfatase modifying factor 1